MFDVVTEFLGREMPYAFEEIARKFMKVQSVYPTNPDLDLDESPILKEKKPAAPSKKGGKAKKIEEKELDYHMSFSRFLEGITSLNKYAIDKHKTGSSSKYLDVSKKMRVEPLDSPAKGDKKQGLDKDASEKHDQEGKRARPTLHIDSSMIEDI
jgi:hypothetical protein